MLDPAPPTKRSPLWLILLIVCLIGAQFLFTRTQNGQPPWLALGVLALGVGLVLASQSQNRWVIRLDEWVAGWLARLWPAAATETSETPVATPKAGRDWGVMASALLTLYVLGQIPRLTASDNYTLVTVAWLAAAGFFLYGITPPDLTWPNWRALWRQHRRLMLGVIALVVIAFILRVWQVGVLPETLNGDEASQGLEAISVIKGTLRNPFGTGWLGVPSMSFFFNSVTIRLFGPTVFALRLPWVLIGTATVFFTFMFVRQLKGKAWGFVAAALVATYHYHIHYSRLGSNQVADPFFLVTSLWLLYRGLDRRSTLSFALSGMVCGLAFYFYAGARLTPVVMIVCLGYLFIRGPRAFWRDHSFNLMIMLGAFMVVFAPMGQYAIMYPNEFNARLNMVGILQNGWLANEMHNSQRSLLAVLFDQFQRAFLAFNFYPDRTVWYGLRQPLLDPFFGSLFLLGLGYGTLRLLGKNADTRMAPMVAWWWGGMILGGMLTESPPSSQRLITLSVPACFFIAVALWELVRLGQPLFAPGWTRGVLVTLVVAFAFISLYTYFFIFNPQRVYGGPHALLATEIAPDLRAMSADNRFYFIGAPEMYWGFSTIPYLAPQADGVDVYDTLTPEIVSALVSRDRGAVFIFLPSRQMELNVVQSVFPEGELIPYTSPVHNGTMVTLYIVPQEQ